MASINLTNLLVVNFSLDQEFIGYSLPTDTIDVDFTVRTLQVCMSVKRTSDPTSACAVPGVNKSGLLQTL